MSTHMRIKNGRPKTKTNCFCDSNELIPDVVLMRIKPKALLENIPQKLELLWCEPMNFEILICGFYPGRSRTK